MNQSWSLIIFGYNEGKTLPSLINSVNIFLGDNEVNDSEIIVVDDGSDDGSESIIQEFEKKIKRVKYLRHKTNLGIGPALHTGYKNANKENVIAIPADGQFDINELEPFINLPEKSFISFYREEMKTYTLYRKILTGVNNVFNKYLLGFEVKDVNWVKAYKTKDLKEIDLKLGSSLINSEICGKLRLKGYKGIESLSVYHKRIAGKSRGSSIKTLSQATKELSKLFFVLKEFKQNNSR